MLAARRELLHLIGRCPSVALDPRDTASALLELLPLSQSLCPNSLHETRVRELLHLILASPLTGLASVIFRMRFAVATRCIDPYVDSSSFSSPLGHRSCSRDE